MCQLSQIQNKRFLSYVHFHHLIYINNTDKNNYFQLYNLKQSVRCDSLTARKEKHSSNLQNIGMFRDFTTVKLIV